MDKFKPFEINKLQNQKIFWDRREVYRLLQENKIPTPKFIIVNRGEIIDNERDFEAFDSEEDENRTKEKINRIQSEITSLPLKREEGAQID